MCIDIFGQFPMHEYNIIPDSLDYAEIPSIPFQILVY